MKNRLCVTCEDVDLTAVRGIEFYLKQQDFFRQYEPQVVSAHEMLVEVPLEDAKLLTKNSVLLQFAFTDPDGNTRATEIESIPVGELLKEADYDPV